MKKDSSRYKNLIAECRRHWNRFDPIGILHEGYDLDDEYDFYLPQTAKLLIEGADAYKIAGYVSQIVRVTIGFRDFPEHRIVEFAKQLRQIDF